MPPPEFDRPFTGELIEHETTVAQRAAGVRSAMRRNWLMDGWTGKPRCDTWITSRDPEAAKLRRIEIANCNGWAARDSDLNLRR